MPSSTFFHLPEEKRRRLLLAARREFARVPYSDASINRIIREAGIPRGSFYMYFTDKEDLFRHLTGIYLQRLAELIEGFLARREGDLFAAFEDVFAFALDCCQEPGADEAIKNLMDILRRNAGLRHETLLPNLGSERLAERLSPSIDTGRLFLRTPEDLGDMLHILMGTTAAQLCAATQTENPAPVRARYHNLLDLLRRGMAREPSHA